MQILNELKKIPFLRKKKKNEHILKRNMSVFSMKVTGSNTRRRVPA